jgi:hypothetical protein
MDSAKEIAASGESLMTVIKERVDPQKTLPQVQLVRDPDRQVPMGTLIPIDMFAMSGDEKIGKATFVADKTSREAWFAGINIDENRRGNGFGLATYLAAIEKASQEGLTFRTHDWTQTEEAKHIWDILVEKGIAKVIEPFIADGRGKYMGRADIKSIDEISTLT